MGWLLILWLVVASLIVYVVMCLGMAICEELKSTRLAIYANYISKSG